MPIDPATPLAVIFDVDGVLVDSWRAHYESWASTARAMDVPFGEAEFGASFGMTSHAVLRKHWRPVHPELSDADLDRIDAEKEAAYRAIIADDFPAIPGAAALIDALHADGIPLAVGSSGPPENIAAVLDHLKRRDRFGAIVSRADVEHGKPAPDIFLRAAERLGVAPRDCVVVEDAPPGVEAARAAGMGVAVLLSGGHRAEDFAGLDPDVIVDSLTALTPAGMRGLVG